MILGGKSWPGWIARTAGATAVWLGGGLVAVREASASIPKPPLNPSLLDLAQWIASGSDPAALIAAVASGLGLVASLFQIFGPKPYTAEQGRRDREHQNASFKAADQRQAARHAEDIAAHHTTQTELAALRAQIAVLTQSIAQKAPDQASSFAEAAEELIASQDESDIELAREVAAGRPEEAADALMREVQEGKQRNAERARQAARLYAPFAPGKAKLAYEEATQLDPADLWSWIELGRLRMAYDGLAAARSCFETALQYVANERDRMVLHNAFGNVLMAEGRLREARHEYEASLAIAEAHVQREPGNLDWQRELSVSHNGLGDVEFADGNLPAARGHFTASLAIRKALAQREPKEPDPKLS